MTKPVSKRRLEATARVLLRLYGQSIRKRDVEQLTAMLIAFQAD